MKESPKEIIDIATEIFNIGMGVAAEALSDLLNQQVYLKIPEVKIVFHKQDVANILTVEGKSLRFISQNFSGDINGICLISFHEAFLQHVIEIVTGKKRTSFSLSPIDNATLEEIGNIILTSFMTGISDISNEKIKVDIPTVIVANAAKIIQESLVSDHLVYSRIEMSFDNVEPKSYLYAFLNFTDIEAIIKKLSC